MHWNDNHEFGLHSQDHIYVNGTTVNEICHVSCGCMSSESAAKGTGMDDGSGKELLKSLSREFNTPRLRSQLNCEFTVLDVN